MFTVEIILILIFLSVYSFSSTLKIYILSLLELNITIHKMSFAVPLKKYYPAPALPGTSSITH